MTTSTKDLALRVAARFMNHTAGAQPGEWYSFGGGAYADPTWFVVVEVQKNGGLSGVQVTWDHNPRKNPKAAKKSYPANQLPKKVSKEDVPDEVREAAREKGAKGA